MCKQYQQRTRGRTIRQFVSGVLAFPTLFSVIWFGIFGMGVFDIELNGGGGLVEAVVDEGDIPGAMFVFLENFPFSTVTSAVGVLIVVLFFITFVMLALSKLLLARLRRNEGARS